jgi:hypothetical protein
VFCLRIKITQNYFERALENKIEKKFRKKKRKPPWIWPEGLVCSPRPDGLLAEAQLPFPSWPASPPPRPSDSRNTSQPSSLFRPSTPPPPPRHGPERGRGTHARWPSPPLSLPWLASGPSASGHRQVGPARQSPFFNPRVGCDLDSVLEPDTNFGRQSNPGLHGIWLIRYPIKM